MGSPTDHHAAPYAMTEEFTACYRMHSLMPDGYSFRSHVDDSPILQASLIEVARRHVPEIYRKVGFDNVIYSLGTSHPGALVLHNFPNGLRSLPEQPDPERPDPERPGQGHFTDVAAIDILRDRERGIPRYCEFRRQLGMPAPASFDELTTDPTWRAEISSLYRNVEDVDFLVGTLAESKASPNGTPPSFGFSDTVFRVFILMASRRLKSDRFFTTDYNSVAYTPEGMEWIDAADMTSVLLRHYPELRAPLRQVENPFAPWQRVGGVGPDPEPPLQTTGREVERAPSARARSDHGEPAPQRR
jgi:hypothetical protein